MPNWPFPHLRSFPHSMEPSQFSRKDFHFHSIAFLPVICIFIGRSLAHLPHHRDSTGGELCSECEPWRTLASFSLFPCPCPCLKMALHTMPPWGHEGFIGFSPKTGSNPPQCSPWAWLLLSLSHGKGPWGLQVPRSPRFQVLLHLVGAQGLGD